MPTFVSFFFGGGGGLSGTTRKRRSKVLKPFRLPAPQRVGYVCQNPCHTRGDRKGPSGFLSIAKTRLARCARLSCPPFRKDHIIQHPKKNKKCGSEQVRRKKTDLQKIPKNYWQKLRFNPLKNRRLLV